MTIRPRTVLRVVGAVLLIAGVTLGAIGLIHFTHDFGSDRSGLGSILTMAGGGFLIVFGLAALSAGFLGAGLNYVASEGSSAAMRLAGDMAATTADATERAARNNTDPGSPTNI